MIYTYILQSQKDGKFYTGSTRDLRRRLKEHAEGKVEQTKGRRPFQLIYYEASLTEKDGRLREKYLKTAWGKRYLKNRMRWFLTDSDVPHEIASSASSISREIPHEIASSASSISRGVGGGRCDGGEIKAVFERQLLQ